MSANGRRARAGAAATRRPPRAARSARRRRGPRDRPARQHGVEPERGPHEHIAVAPARRARAPAPRRDAPRAAVAPLERVDELGERRRSVGSDPSGSERRAPDQPRQLGSLGVELGRERARSARSATARWKSRWSSRRRVDACPGACGRGRAARAGCRLGVREQPRPEVVVLALRERRVVAKPVALEHVRGRRPRVGWKNGEEKSAAQRTARAPRASGGAADATVAVELDDRRCRRRPPPALGGCAPRAARASAGSATSSASSRAT